MSIEVLSRCLWKGRIIKDADLLGAAMIFIVVLLLATTAVVYWAASNLNHGIYWADRICTDAPILCDNPRWLLIASAIAIIIALVRHVTNG
jgi:hypothetical protein